MDSNDRRKWFDKLFKGKKDDKPKPYQRPPVPPGYEEFWIGPIPFRRRKQPNKWVQMLRPRRWLRRLAFWRWRKKPKRRPSIRTAKAKQKQGCLQRNRGCIGAFLKFMVILTNPHGHHSSGPSIEVEIDIFDRD